MAETAIFMYGITAGVMIFLVGLLFGTTARRLGKGGSSPSNLVREGT